MGSIIISVAVAATGVAIGLARGGRLDALLAVRPRWWGLLAGGFALLVVVENADIWQAPSLAVVAMFCLLVGLVANSTVPGALITAFGVSLNLAVLVLNGSVPVRFEALREAGLVDGTVERSEVTSVGHLLELETADTRLGSLGDTIPIGSLDSVISIGDLVTFAGVIVMISNLIAARRRVGLDVDELFAAPAPVEFDLDVPSPPLPTAPAGVLDLANDEPIIDVSDLPDSERASIRSDRTARAVGAGDPFDPDDLWADDDTGIKILGPSSKST